MIRTVTTTVAEVAVTCPELHGPLTTVGELDELFLDDHVHIALVVDGRRLVSAVERTDLERRLDPDLPALGAGTLDGRTVPPDALAAETLAGMQRTGRRRLAVVDGEGHLVGLLCLKARGHGFCSNEDVASRKRSHEYSGPAAAGSGLHRSGVCPDPPDQS